jgi:hypothetical protein
MGGRFGKYGDLKRKERLRKTRLRPPDFRQRKKEKSLQDARKREKRCVVRNEEGEKSN